LVFKNKVMLASALALAVIAPVAITGCDSGSPAATATVVTNTAPTATTVKGPQDVPTREVQVPEGQQTAGPGAVETTDPQVTPR
jgi:outer membrane lipoprotein SlyB